jgi:transcriptional regulator with XRE-family HTH domain
VFGSLTRVGYRGKTVLRERARALRGQGWTMPDIAAELGVARSSVSLWTRDVSFAPEPRRRARQRGPNVLQRRKQDEIEALLAEGRTRIGSLSEREFLVAGAALYAGEGSKRDGSVFFANSDPSMVAFFCAWMRRFFAVDELRLRMRVYLHEGLNLEAAQTFWSDVSGVPLSQFGAAYRAKANETIRVNKHPYGCAYLRYSCSHTHRAIMGLVAALLTSSSLSGVAQSAERWPVKPKVVSSSLTPGALEDQT